MFNKILITCRNVPAYKLACFRLATTLSSLISNLKLLITTYSNDILADETFFTDRRYYRKDYNKDRGKKKCFIYSKQGY